MPRKSSNSAKVYYPELSREKLVEILRAGLEKLNLEEVKLAILFGSYATNRYTVASDVDLFVVVSDQSDVDQIYNKLVKNLEIRRLEPHIIRESEYKKLKAQGSKWIQAIEREGILLYGKTS